MGIADLLTGLLPRPTVDTHACSRRLGSGCTVCVDACPKDALQVISLAGRDDHAPTVDPLTCVGCGLCEAQCPVQAISGVAADGQLLVDAARGKAVLRLRCEVARLFGGTLAADRPDAVGLDVGCLASLHSETVAATAGALTADGAVELLRGDCETCPMGAGEAVASMIDEAGTTLAGARRIHVGVAAQTSEPAEATNRPTAKLSRRALFRKASPTLAAEDAVRAGTSAQGGRTPRQLVLEFLENPSLPRPSAKAGCTGCQACINVCPREALESSVIDDVFTLTVDPSACVQCRECVRVCPENVVEPGGRLIDLQPQILTQVQLTRCDVCGMWLSPGEVGRCASCSSRQSLVSDVWSQYGL